MDGIFLELMHLLCEYAGTFFTPFFVAISFLGEKSWFFILIATVLCLSKKTRWIGATAILSIFLCFLLSDFIIKPLIMRPRPFQSSSEVFFKYWKMAGEIMDDGFSMPSGHTLGVVTFFTSIIITYKKSKRKYLIVVGIIMTTLMIFSRCYLMHHYFTDCIVSIILGIIISFITKKIISFIIKLCITYKKIPIFNFALNFDFFKLFNKEISKKDIYNYYDDNFL